MYHPENVIYNTFIRTPAETILKQHAKAWFPPMRLTYLHVYSYENKYNPIGGNASNNLKKNNLTSFHDIISLLS